MENTLFTNPSFERIYAMAGESQNGSCIEQAVKSDGNRALKGTINGLFRFIVVPSIDNKGISVKLIDRPGHSDRINNNGEIRFTSPLNTENCKTLVKQIRCWLEAYETIYGLDGYVYAEKPTDIQVIDQENNDEGEN